MPCSLLSIREWAIRNKYPTPNNHQLFFSQLLYLVAILNLIDEYLGRLKAWDIMFVNNNSGVARNIAGNFFLSLLINKTSKTTNVNIMTAGHIGFNNVEKSLYGCGDICLVDPGFFCDLIDYVCFGHGIVGF